MRRLRCISCACCRRRWVFPPPPPTQLTLPPPLLQNLGQQNNNNQQPISIMDVLFFDIQLAASVVHSNRMLTGTTQLMFKG